MQLNFHGQGIHQPVFERQTTLKMAVPDPDMFEMRIMAYASRKRTRAAQSIPRRNDFIEVLWCMDHLPGLPEKWCPAEVLHVTGVVGQHNLASAVILYLPDDNWDEQIHNVIFLENNKLRRLEDDFGNCQDEDKNDNPALEWKFARSEEHRSPGRDEEWLPEKEHSLRRGFHDIRNADQESDIMAIREGHAALAVELQKVKRELASLYSQLSCHVHHRQPKKALTGVGTVLSRLRYKLATKAQMCLKPSHTLSNKKKTSDSETSVRTGDGIHVGAIRIKVECTLHQFEGISRIIKSDAGPNSVWFFPDFALTQLPSRSSATFSILFSTFAELTNHIAVSSKADRLDMIRKCGSGPQGDILRMMGTLSYHKTDVHKPTYLFPGGSCGSDFDILCNQSQGTEAAQLHPVLTRKSREWNAVDKRFVHNVCLSKVSLPHLSEKTSELEAFQLQWRRAPDLSSRSWSRAITDEIHVHGWLEMIVPFVQTQGRQLCVEIGGLASDDVLQEII